MTTKALAVQQPSIPVAYGLSQEQTDLIKRTIAKGASNDELSLFVAQCNRTGLDPFSKQIYLVPRKSREGGTTRTIQVGIDGLRLIAERTGKYAGQEGPWWCGEDGKWVDVWLTREPPIAAKVHVLRKDFSAPMVGIALMSAYRPTYPSEFWSRMPAHMLAKVAESLALRRAFPQETSGLFIAEEMRESEAEQEPPPPEDPPPGVDTDPHGTEVIYDAPHRALSPPRRASASTIVQGLDVKRAAINERIRAAKEKLGVERCREITQGYAMDTTEEREQVAYVLEQAIKAG